MKALEYFCFVAIQFNVFLNTVHYQDCLPNKLMAVRSLPKEDTSELLHIPYQFLLSNYMIKFTYLPRFPLCVWLHYSHPIRNEFIIWVTYDQSQWNQPLKNAIFSASLDLSGENTYRFYRVKSLMFNKRHQKMFDCRSGKCHLKSICSLFFRSFMLCEVCFYPHRWSSSFFDDRVFTFVPNATSRIKCNLATLQHEKSTFQSPVPFVVCIFMQTIKERKPIESTPYQVRSPSSPSH